MVDLYSPDTYVDAPPHEEFARLRAEDPVHWVDMPDEPGYWAVLRHADVVAVSRNPAIFSATEGGVVLENLDEESLAGMREMLLAMDPPRHSTYRQPVSDKFKARVIAAMEGQIREICRGLMANAKEQGSVEWVHDVCAHLPSQVLGQLMGLPEDDWPAIHAMAERNSGGQDPDINNGDRGKSSMEMAQYAMAWAAERRERPADDLTTFILGADFGGKRMTDLEFAYFFVQLVTAGNDTTRTLLSSGTLALLENPDQLALLRREPDRLADAVEEMLRYANPLHYFRRTAKEDTEVAGQPIAAGEKVAMIYTSANRDEAVFDEPNRFDITRHPNPHLSFGIAQHFCLGVHLARLEGRVFFEEMVAAFESLELVGEPARQRSNLNNSLKTLPLQVA